MVSRGSDSTPSDISSAGLHSGDTAYRRSLRRSEHPPRARHRGHLAQRRSLWPDDRLSAAERNCATSQPAKSAASKRYLLNSLNIQTNLGCLFHCALISVFQFFQQLFFSILLT